VQLLQAKLSGRFSSPEVAKVEASAAEAHAAYTAAQELLHHSNVTAPFAGTVYQLPVKPGSYVNGGDLLVQVANLEKVRVRAFVDEPEIGRLAKGQKVEIKWDATPGRTWEGTLTRVPTSVTMVGTRTVGEITSEIDNSDRKLLPNVNVNVSIISARHDNALTVSREAVHDVDGKRYVYKIENEKDSGTGSTDRAFQPDACGSGERDPGRRPNRVGSHQRATSAQRHGHKGG